MKWPQAEGAAGCQVGPGEASFPTCPHAQAWEPPARRAAVLASTTTCPQPPPPPGTSTRTVTITAATSVHPRAQLRSEAQALWVGFVQHRGLEHPPQVVLWSGRDRGGAGASGQTWRGGDPEAGWIGAGRGHAAGRHEAPLPLLAGWPRKPLLSA